MLVLGWHGGWTPPARALAPTVRARPGVIGHDAAAIVLRDGAAIAGIEEERLSRMKHSNFFPAQAIRFCLATAGASLADFDAIAMDSSEEFVDLWLLQSRLGPAAARQRAGRAWIASLFQEQFGVDVSDKLVFCRHHIAHVQASWSTSGFDEGLALCLDAAGDGPSGLVAHCRGDEVKVLRQIAPDRSLGYFYLRLIAFLGYRLFDEYKVMGLAPYGRVEVYRAVLGDLFRLLPQGQYALAGNADISRRLAQAGLGPLMRRKGEPFIQSHMDFAAALQEALQAIVRHVLAHFSAATGLRRLCLSGGVAQNCSLNGDILASGLFDEVHVPPAAHDGGNALGAALFAARSKGGSTRFAEPFRPYLGTAIGSDEEIGARLQAWRAMLTFRRLAVADVEAEASARMAAGAVIAWVQGRSEFGPRALGNRSILADPRPEANKQIINAMVKKREGYRPFAPSVVEERVGDFFDVPAGVTALPYMTIIVPVREQHRRALGAITHVDGTARVQTVSAAANPRYHRLLQEFGARTGFPVLLNTSLNNNAEPIVDSVDDAITCFLTTDIDQMFIGDWLVEKAGLAQRRAALLDLVPALYGHHCLNRAEAAGGAEMFSIDSASDDVFGESSMAISAALYRALLAPAATASLAARLRAGGVTRPDELEHIGHEVFDLWQRRALSLAPLSTTPSITEPEEQQ